MKKIKNFIMVLIGVAVVIFGILYITNVIDISVNLERFSSIASTSWYTLNAVNAVKSFKKES